MRNFKKFLALVLAMLMVSACAVSVSAAFNDQAAIDATDFEDAVEILAELGVVKGDENQNFNPNNTLRRDEAAVIIAKLVAGIAGQSMDWTAATTKFADVDAAWSFAYINYVADRKIMVGSNIGFEPTRELQIDEALALALKAADPAAVRNVEIMNAQYPTNYWATYYISAAEELGLADNLGIIYDHEAACSRAMFAQIAVNMLNNSAIGTAFGYQTIDGYITSVDADNNKLFLNTLGEKAINLAAFNATLAEAGYDKVAADMIDYKVSMQWSNKTGEIFEIDVLSSVDTYNYTDAAIKYVPKDDTVEAAKLELNGKVYDIAANDYRYDEDDVSDIIGGTLADDLNNIRFYDVNNHNEITTVVKDATIPAFYEVACFDDDADGDYERAYVTTYTLVTLTKGSEINHDGKDDTAKVVSTVVKAFAADGSAMTQIADKYLTVAGAGYTAWGETPVLVVLTHADELNMSGKILETADKVTGVVSSIKADKYITINNAIEFAAAYADPASWTLSQNVTVYTIGGKYVAVASADTGVESGKVDKKVVVDNVTVADGVALIDGYYWNSNGTLTAVEDFKVVGYVNSADKLIAKASAEVKNVVSDKTYAGYVGIGTLTDAGTAFKADDHIVTFYDGSVYTFYVTSEGAYFKAVVDNVNNYAASASTPAVDVKSNGYIYIGGVAQYKLADAYTILAKSTIGSDKAEWNNAYAKQTFTTLSSFTFDSATVSFRNAAGSVVAAGQTDDKVAFIFATASANAQKHVLTKKLGEGETIVQLVSVENETLTESTFNAIDIFTGAAVTVTGNDQAGNYAVVKDGKIVDDNTMWVEEGLTLNVAINVDGKVYSGYNRMIHADHEGKNGYMDNDMYKDDACESTNYKDMAKYGIDKITYWTFKDGAIKEAGKLDDIVKGSLGTNGVLTFNGCIINGQVIILDTPTYGTIIN